MKPTDEERREAAENLRTMCVCGCRYAEQFYELLKEKVMNAWDFHDFPDVAYRLADLIEPEPERTCRAEVLRCREDDGSQSACLVCSECGEKLRYREAAADDGEPDYELLPCCAGCGARVEGADEVAEHAQACGTCGSFRRCCGCGSGWCMELLRPVRDDEAACEEHDPDAGGRSRG